VLLCFNISVLLSDFPTVLDIIFVFFFQMIDHILVMCDETFVLCTTTTTGCLKKNVTWGIETIRAI